MARNNCQKASQAESAPKEAKKEAEARPSTKPNPLPDTGYTSDHQMLADYFRLIDIRRKGHFLRHRDEEEREAEISALRKRIDIGIRKANPGRQGSFLLDKFRLPGISSDERLLVACLCYYASKPGDRGDLSDAFEVVCRDDRMKMLRLNARLKNGTRLFKAGLLCEHVDASPFHRDTTIALAPEVIGTLWGLAPSAPKPKKPAPAKAEAAPVKITSPRDVYNAISEYVIGQEEAKQILSVAVYNHYQRINGRARVAKANILMAGPTGCGKTHLAETISRFLDVPLVIADANQYSETGYVGGDVMDILRDLYKASGENRERAARGIVYIDEVDKIAAAYDNGKHRSNRDVSGESVQAELLKIIEGGCCASLPFDASQVLFIAGGAFSGIVNRGRRLEARRPIGFGREGEAAKGHASSGPSLEDFIAYGMLPEFMGRFQVRVVLDGLDRHVLRRILCEPKDSIVSQYQSLFRANGIELHFAPEALDRIAEEAEAQKVGARGLKSIVERVLNPLMFRHFGEPGRGARLVVDGFMVEESVIDGRRPHK